MPKHDKPILDIHVGQANHNHFHNWETHFRDYCFLESYRNQAKNRLTETAEHYVTAKRPFELAILQSAIPPTGWNTLDQDYVIASKDRN